ncbi:hypothetical protein B0G75_102253 [Paraburkholderia sp. BL18I3N2]|uniref:hypothetical protein n=1 Tax=Paraburkholderia sp. BL18I3N2 TaxID=1938799 RepID=UPI000D4A5B72|nr:hypothetical protein [Paraburkholderia sp. BL18I3N2]PRX34224.1 hypothetical protein B0G75_102253 [Paraburkholderia sp. BL18I3N2]
MSTTPLSVMRLSDLFTSEEITTLSNAQLRANGYRHPTWFALRNSRAVDALVHLAVPTIAREAGGEAWLRDLAPRLNDFEDDRNASSSLAEIRAYGGLLEAGFQVKPVPRKNTATPDFTVDAGDGPVTVEVFSKHQDEDQDDLMAAANTPDGEHPHGIERSTRTEGDRAVRTAMTELTPAGRPDTTKPGDSVQANVISRVCSVKSDETQVNAERPCVLVADFTHFGAPPVAQFLSAHQTSPLIRGHQGLCSGGMWYGVYGWKGAPVFEELLVTPKRMGHDGRFRLAGKKKSRLSAVLFVFVFHEDVVLLENPWA